MLNLEVNLLGAPTAKLNGKEIEFPYQKVEALFYYLVVKKEISRDKIATLLWGSMVDDKAKKNLRNALYQLKKIIGKEIITTPDRFTIAICEDCNLQLDIDIFLAKKLKKSVQVYQGDFLSDFLIKKAPEFCNWIFEQRNYYRQLYINSLKRQIKEYRKEAKIQEAINYLKLLIKVDEFDEVAYRNLMELYVKQGAVAKAISTYKELEEQLNKELGITPDRKTVDFLQHIRENLSSNVDDNNQYNQSFIGREDELQSLVNNLYKFLQGEVSYSYFIFGEAGIGKTTLVKQALSLIELDEALLLETNCFQAEEHYVFKPWNNILEQLKDKVELDNIDISLPWKKIISFLFPSFLAEEEELLPEGMLNFESIQSQSAIEALLFLLTEVAKEKKLVLFFEDLQWCDDKSLYLLKNLIQKSKNNNILILMTSRNERKERVENIFLDLKRYELIKKINLPRLSFKELKEFVQKSISDYSFSEELLMTIYNETEGNTFFLVEALNLLKEGEQQESLSNFITTKSKDILRNRVLSVSKEAQKILRLMSVCFDQVSYDLLAKISGKNDLKLIELLEELQEYYLIEELQNKQGEVPSYRFTHSKIREFIYKQQSFSRINLLHKRIAQILEDNLPQKNRSRDRYAKLLYHYSRTGDKLKHLEYLIKEAELYFHHTHELYPIVNDKNLGKDKILSFNQKGSRCYLSKAEALLDEIEQGLGRSIKLQQMEVKFLNIKTRFLIAQGKYDEAISHINQAIPEAKELDDQLGVLNNYQQMAGIGIQKEDFSLIEENSEKMYNLAKQLNREEKMGVALRFFGIAKLYQRDYKEAEKLFKEALQAFKDAETMGNKYTLGIAAVYNYLGEVKRYVGEFLEAKEYYQRSINLCEEKDILSGLGIFYTNAGQVLYELDKYKQANRCFNKALEIFGQLRIIWGYSSIANGFRALLSIQFGDYKEAFDYLQVADSIIEQHHKRYWSGIILRVKTKVAKEMEGDKKLQEVFGEYLDKDYSRYAQKALVILQEIGADYELDLINDYLEID
ncbi:tetratricopeptide repeat protein [Natroniella acetigena]|uniref:tetratricopeptide repeat protein n=1 Tax=Natroniella acetigena TaxID=52004 RepID=UPI00200B4426|nr:tetratricopeptide repeat protein [Natroniella acetigena]MCK8827294.1 tetratricopeptide repeat protein [Natroniella acetigena]